MTPERNDRSITVGCGPTVPTCAGAGHSRFVHRHTCITPVGRARITTAATIFRLAGPVIRSIPADVASAGMLEVYDNAVQGAEGPAGGPELVLEEYFSGHTRACGFFEDRAGRVRREFVAEIDGEWDGRRLTLTERFVYSDGEEETRVWALDKTGPDTYMGFTDAVVGEAVGRTDGNAFSWQYDFKLPVAGGVWKVHFDDRMFLQPNGVLLNKATVSRWGVRIGTVFISFQKQALPVAA